MKKRFYSKQVIEKSLRHHLIEWAATILSITGALFIALKMEEGFYIFILSNILWAVFSIKHRHLGLLVTNLFFFLINLIGIYYWQ